MPGATAPGVGWRGGHARVKLSRPVPNWRSCVVLARGCARRILTPVIVHWITLGAAFAFLLRINRDQWFFGDDWAFLTDARRDRPFVHELLDPHNEHWSTGPYLVFRVLEATIGLDPYWPYVLPVVLAHLLLTHLLFRLALRVGGDPWIALAASTAFVFLGAGYENLLWAFQIGFVGSVALGAAAMLAVDHPGPWNARDSVAIMLAVLSLTFSGLGILMTGTVTLTVLLHHGWRRAGLFLVVPAGVYLVWHAGFYSGSQFAAPNIEAYVSSVYPFVLRGMTNAVDVTIGADRAAASGVGLALLLVLVAALVRHVDLSRGRAAAAYAGAAGAVGLYALTAYGRWGLGIEQSVASRYVYVADALLLPAAVLALTWLVGRSRAGVAIVAVVLAAVALNGINELREFAGPQATQEQAIRDTLLAAAKIASDRHQPLVPGALPEPNFSPDVTVGDLFRWERAGELGDSSIPALADLNAALNLQVAITDGHLVGVPTARGPCRRLASGESLTIAVTDPAGFRIQSGGTAHLEVRLHDTAGNRSAVRRFVARQGRSFLSLLRAPSRASVTQVDDAPLLLCGSPGSSAR